MKDLNYFTKTVVIVLAIAVIAFVASIFVYPSEDLYIDPRADVCVVALLLVPFAFLALLVMVIVKKWRKASFLPLALLLGSIIIFFVFDWEGIHFKKNLDKSIQKVCIEYCMKKDVRINPSSLNFIKKEEKKENMYYDYICTFTAEIPEEGFVDTVKFYVVIFNYNRNGYVYDSYRVLSSSNVVE